MRNLPRCRHPIRIGITLLVAVSVTSLLQSISTTHSLEATSSRGARTAAQDATGPADPVFDTQDELSAIAFAIEVALLAQGEVPGDDELGQLMHEFYTARHYRPAWLDGTARTAATELLERIEAADEDGLCSTRYGAHLLRARLASMKSGGAEGAATAAALDLELTRAILHFAVHLSRGYVATETWRASARSEALLTRLEELRDPQRLTTALARLEPVHSEYRDLRRALAEHRAIVRRGGWPELPGDVRLQPGDTSEPEHVRLLAARLTASGDLDGEWSEEQDLHVVPGSDDEVEPARPTYEGELVESVRRFQARHGLVVDGIVGPDTLRALNVPAAQRLRQIALNMDRWRRLPDDLGARHVRVNIPAYRLHVVEGGTTMLEMRTIVGRPVTATPMFSDRIQYLEFSPYWNVPDSIARNELVPQAAEDPSLLERRGFEVLTGWGENAERIDPTAVDWDAEEFGYRLRQRPGPANALGRVKFMFPNRFSVYLHDTPGRHLFQRTRRAFSHGCVRVERPAALAELLLDANDGWTAERVRHAMANGRRQVVPLGEAVPVHLLYMTSFVDDEGVTQFRDDVYGRDRRASSRVACKKSPAIP